MTTIDTRAIRSFTISVLYWVCVLAVLTVVQVPAEGAFTGDYALSNFTLTNQNADGFAILNGSGGLVLTGGNNGSNLPGFTDLTIAATAAGMVSFDYRYESEDTPGYDLAGYKAAGSLHLLAEDFQVGTVSFLIDSNQVFGFRVGTEDNTGRPGILTISNFSAPSANSPEAVPEPATFSLLSVAAVSLAVWRVRSMRLAKRLRGVPA
jgi:hypothetical protein